MKSEVRPPPKTGVIEVPRPNITEEIIRLGGQDVLICYQCGSCTAICPLAEKYKVSFRKSIKYAQLGVERSLLGDLVPWLCNLHGDCVESCPRDAKPSTILGAIRSYQSIKYDWTGISKWWFHSSLKSKLGAILALAFLTLIGVFMELWPTYSSFINSGVFAVTRATIQFATIIAAISFFLIATNAIRMYRFVGGGKDYRLGFFSALKLQLKYWTTVESEALRDPKKRYRILEHTLILIGLGILLIVLFVNGVEFYGIYPLKSALYGVSPIFKTLHKLALYAASLLILIGSLSPISKRVFKTEKTHWYYKEFSHSSDWASLILVFSVSLTALLTLLLNDLKGVLSTILGGSGAAIGLTYIMLSIHLSVLVPFMLLEMPFGKHTHWIYRVIANYVATRKGYLGGV